MGGYGSTRWGLHTPKQKVEDGLTLSLRPLRDVLRAGEPSAGGITWRWVSSGKETASIGYTFNPDPARLRLRYTKDRGTDRETDLDYPVELVTTAQHFGGVRWWFVCPLVKGERPCRRRCGKLYLPPGARYFGCRACYDLTYESSREAHKYDGLYRVLAGNLGCSFEEVKSALARW